MTSHNGMPRAQGLYDPANEHDNCGVGFIANIKGRKSHDIVKRGITGIDVVKALAKNGYPEVAEAILLSEELY